MSGHKWELNPGDGAFYGPKVSTNVLCVGGEVRKWFYLLHCLIAFRPVWLSSLNLEVSVCINGTVICKREAKQTLHLFSNPWYPYLLEITIGYTQLYMLF